MEDFEVKMLDKHFDALFKLLESDEFREKLEELNGVVEKEYIKNISGGGTEWMGIERIGRIICDYLDLYRHPDRMKRKIDSLYRQAESDGAMY